MPAVPGAAGDQVLGDSAFRPHPPLGELPSSPAAELPSQSHTVLLTEARPAGPPGDSPFSAQAPRRPLGLFCSREHPYIFTCEGDKDVPQLLSTQPSNWRVIP